MESIIILRSIADKFYQQVIDTENYNATLNDTMQPTNDALNKLHKQCPFLTHLIPLNVP